MTRKRRHAAHFIVFLGLAALAVAIFALKDVALVELYIHCLKHGDEATRHAAARRLGEMGSARALPSLLEVFKEVASKPEPNDWKGDWVLDPILRIGGHAAIPQLLESLTEESRLLILDGINNRRGLYEDLNQNEPLLSFLLAFQHDLSPKVRARAVEMLASNAPGTDRVLQALVSAIEDPNAEVRQSAARELILSDFPSEVLLPICLDLLENKDFALRWMGTRNLTMLHEESCIQSDTARIVAALIPLLKDETPEVRDNTASALGEFGARATTAVPALLHLLEDPGFPGDAAGSALSQIGSAAVEPLIRALEDESPRVRARAAEALGSIGGEARSAVPALVRFLGEADDIVRSTAASALGRIGPEAAAGVSGLVKLLRDASEDTRAGAAWSLGEIGAQAAPAVPALREMLQAKKVHERLVAAESLWKITGNAELVIPFLTDVLGAQNPHDGLVAAQILGRMGPGARAAVPALRGAMKEQNGFVCSGAAEALKKIEE